MRLGLILALGLLGTGACGGGESSTAPGNGNPPVAMGTDPATGDPSAPTSPDEAPTDDEEDLGFTEGTVPVGGACEAGFECMMGRCETRIGAVAAPGGFCTRDCSSDADCGDNGLCGPGLIRSCTVRCDSTADCRDGYLCEANPLDFENQGVTVCRPSPPVGELDDGLLSMPCAVDEDCPPDGRCVGRVFGQRVDGGYCTLECAVDEDCGPGGFCAGGADSALGTSGSCYLQCVDDAACLREGFSCQVPVTNDGIIGGVGGALGAPEYCLPTPDVVELEPGVAGRACVSDDDCGGGECETQLLRLTAPDGYCSASCMTDNDMCGTGAQCVAGLTRAQCLKTCTDNDECRDGYVCRSGDPTDALGLGMLHCVPPMPEGDPLPAGVTGSSCTMDADCAPGGCESQLLGLTAVDGYCTTNCNSDDTCGLGAECVPRAFGGSICMKLCQDVSECRAGYECRSGDITNLSGGLLGPFHCVPPMN